MAVNKLTFEEGEKREVTTTITSANSKETIVIASAEFELVKAYGNSVTQKGNCEIIGNQAISFLDLAQKGEYELKVTMKVGREVVIKTTLVVIE